MRGTTGGACPCWPRRLPPGRTWVFPGRRRLQPIRDVAPHPADVLPAAPPDAVGMTNATINGISIDYSVAGDGPPVLLICGTGQPADLWFAQVADLTAAG